MDESRNKPGRAETVAQFISRRRFPRFEVNGHFAIRDLTSQSDRELLDISFGGFRSTSTTALEPGRRHEFAFPLRPPATVPLSARVIHCYRMKGAPGRYVVGWLWTDVVTNVEGVPIRVAAVIDHLSSPDSHVDLVKL